MPSPSFEALPPAIAAALENRGFTALTAVQEAVLDPALAGRDLRVSSQTGSGKTVAIGLVLAPMLSRITEARAAEAPQAGKHVPTHLPSKPAPARPAALLIAPTRELAAQLARELSWLFEPIGVRVACVTGGAGYALELRALRQSPLVVVGTPGRLLDHLERGAIDSSFAEAVVLDEADQMLDLGFRDELESILQKTPAERRTHLVSATFPREVTALANRYQTDAARVEGTGHGEANEDIEHLALLVRAEQREAALINLLLLAPGERTLVFVRTRAEASDLADRLCNAGFSAGALSGELEQRERTRILEAFRSGTVTTLVATDVAARGLDVSEVNRVIHADPPGDADGLTHRSGRTGRAGRKGTAILLVPPPAREMVIRLYRRARIEPVWKHAPSPADVRRAADERLLADLGAPPPEGSTPDPRLRALAEKLLSSGDPVTLVTNLLARTRHDGPCAPREVTAITPPPPRASSAPRTMPPPGRGAEGGGGQSFVPFRINWGQRHGADPRRLLALVCRRGGIEGFQVGAIRIGQTASTFEVSAPVAGGFAQAVRKPDARDPRIRIDPMEPVPAGAAPEAERPRPPRRERPATQTEGSGGLSPPRRQPPRWS